MSSKEFDYHDQQGVAYAVVSKDAGVAYKATLAQNAPARRLQYQPESFAPERQGNAVKTFTTGEAYFADVCAAIQGASKSVFITGWQVNWAATLSKGTRLIDALKKAVENGAKVYVMPWQSPKVGVNTGDLGTMLAVFQLNAGRSKLAAFCCPAGMQNDYEGIEETFFSHHQKLVVIDNVTAYVGGIDLAFGRHDDNSFSLAHGWRTGPEVYNTGVPPAHDLLPAEATAFVTETELLKATLTAGLLNDAVQTQSAASKAVGSSRLGKAADRAMAWWREPLQLPIWLREGVDDLSDAVKGPFDKAQQAAADRIIRKIDKNLLTESDVTQVVNLARDAVRNTYTALLAMSWVNRKPNAELFQPGKQSLPTGDATFRADQPRLPWQDVHVRIDGPSVYDLSQNFIRRWNSLQKSYLPDALARHSRIAGPLLPAPPAAGKGNGGTGGVMVRVLRSAPLALQQDEAKATPGLPPPVGAQDEIHEAMVSVIRRAEHFIYIENQFFQSGFGKPSIDPDDKAAMSGPLRYLLANSGNRIKSAMTRVSADNVSTGPKNHIARALAERIEFAIRNDQNFHVYMVLPVHPEGSLADLAIVGQIHWTMQSLVFASDSLVNRIRVAIRARQLCKQEGKEARSKGDWEAAKAKARIYDTDTKRFEFEMHVRRDACKAYLTLINLRNCQTVGGAVRTEQIYVHSKLLIADDRVVILGSANINDRSLAGGRDSELAVYLTDLSSMDAPLDGKNPTKVRTLAHKLRVDLWEKHFALKGGNDVVQPATGLASMVDKPADPATWRAIQKIATANAKAHKAAFRWIPDGASSLWPVWERSETFKETASYSEVKDRVAPSERAMPFSEEFWKSPPAASKPSGVQGFICELPMEWTLGENNHPGMNMILLTHLQRYPMQPNEALDRSALAGNQGSVKSESAG